MLRDDWKPDLDALLEKLIEGEFTAADRDRLNEILAGGREPRRYYRGYMRLHYGLEWRIGKPDLQGRLASGIARPADGPPSVTGHSTLGPFGRLPLSYAIASVVLGAIIAAVWAWQVISSLPAVPAATVGVGRKTAAPADAVGKITVMVDCRWADAISAVVDGADVPAGRKLRWLPGSSRSAIAPVSTSLFKAPQPMWSNRPRVATSSLEN